MRLDEQVRLIIAINHAWKRQRQIWGAESACAKILQGRKSSLQTQLLTTFPTDTYLKLDTENTEGEPLYSVRLRQPILLDKLVRTNAEHIPQRIAEELLTSKQIAQRLEV
jgi:hypothetical protein